MIHFFQNNLLALPHVRLDPQSISCFPFRGHAVAEVVNILFSRLEENVKCKDLPVLHDILFSKIVRKRENKDLPVLHDISGQPCLVLGEKIHPGLDVFAYTGHQQLLHLTVHLDFH